jgi:hypothetical protein
VPEEVYPTTAENVIGATEAALQKPSGVGEALVAGFLDVPNDSAKCALQMAGQLGLVLEQVAGNYTAVHPHASYLSVGDPVGKAAFLRLVLEQYPPYKTFKYRLALTGVAAEAANQTKALHGLQIHRQDLLSTFVSLGTYTHSLASEGAGLYKVVQDQAVEYLRITAEIVQLRESAELVVRKRLGSEAAGEIHPVEVLAPLVTAYQSAARAAQDSRAPVVHAGNAVESFLVQCGTARGINLQNATGLNAKADELYRQNVLLAKHMNMLKYLGHVRNAADHGTDVDPVVGHTWQISETTAVEYVHVAMSTISAIVAFGHQRFVV